MSGSIYGINSNRTYGKSYGMFSSCVGGEVANSKVFWAYPSTEMRCSDYCALANAMSARTHSSGGPSYSSQG